MSPGSDDDDRIVVVVVTAERRHADRGRVARAALLGLFDEGDVGPRRRLLLDLLGDLLGAMADDDDRARRVELLEGVDDVQRPSAGRRCGAAVWVGSDRMRVPAPAARRIAETAHADFCMSRCWQT